MPPKTKKKKSSDKHASTVIVKDSGRVEVIRDSEENAGADLESDLIGDELIDEDPFATSNVSLEGGVIDVLPSPWDDDASTEDFLPADLKQESNFDENDEAHEQMYEHYLPAVVDKERDDRIMDLEKAYDPLTAYLREIARYDLLSPEQEKALTHALSETGDIEVAKKLVRANLRLVVKIAMEYRRAYSNVLDLIQEGNIGLMKAVSKFDPSKGAKLSYYASWWIRSFILKFILDNFRMVKIGTTSEQKKLFFNLLREKERLMQLGQRPDVKLLSANLGVSEKAVELMDYRLSSAGTELSLDKPFDQDDPQGSSLLDMLSSAEGSPEEEFAQAQSMEILKKNLGNFVATLNPRDREIFQKRLLTEIPPSLQSIADEYGVSRERIRQVEERLIEKLKVYMSEFIR